MRTHRITSTAKILLIGLFFIIIGVWNNAYAAETIPKVQKITTYNPIYEGETQTISVVSNYSGNVQYRISYTNRSTGGDNWIDLTNGYTPAVNGQKEYTITTPKLSAGKYTISVWVKRDGQAPADKRGFDSYLSTDMVCSKSSSIPKIQSLIPEYETVYDGDTQTIDVITNYPGKVQYRVSYVNRDKGGEWTDITNGYTEAVDGRQVYRISTPKLSTGKYTFSVWVKRAGQTPADKRGFDSYLGLDVVSLENTENHSNVKFDGIKNSYSLGESINVSNKEGKDYEYSYKVHDLINNKDLVGFTAYSNSFTWKPSTEGLYLLNINLKSVEKVPITKPDSENQDIDKNEELDKNKEEEVSTDDTTKTKQESVEKEENEKEIDKEASEEAESAELKEEPSKGEENPDKIVDDETATDNEDEAAEEKVDEGKTSSDEQEPSTEDAEDQSTGEDGEKEEEPTQEVEYKEVVTITKINKLIVVGDPYRSKTKVTKTPAPATPVISAPKVSSLVVGNAPETQRIYIKQNPSASSKNVGYIYGSLSNVKIIKAVGNFYYIQATDYNTLKPVKGYVYKSQLKTVKPSGSYSVLVDLSDQRVRVFKGDKLIRTIVCSTGQDWTPTPTGIYLIGDRGPSFYTGTNNSIICYNWVRFNNDFLFHSTLHTKSGYEIQSEAKKLGQKASHGCIRMPLNDIKWFYNTIPRGTLVVIQQ